MEFFEAPPFTRYLRDYLADEEYNLQYLLAQNPELGDMMPGTAAFASCAGRTSIGAKDGEEACGLSITTLPQNSRFG